jgi:V/A-type H+-transporting ATPase subunit K
LRKRLNESEEENKQREGDMDKILIAFAAALAIGLPALATAWAQSKIGAAGAGTLAEKPELSGTIIILIAIPETMVILGFVVAVIILLGG